MQKTEQKKLDVKFSTDNEERANCRAAVSTSKMCKKQNKKVKFSTDNERRANCRAAMSTSRKCKNLNSAESSNY